MKNFAMLMCDAHATQGWDVYIEKLLATGQFRGGTSLGQGVRVQRGKDDGACQVTGIIRFEAEGLEEAKTLLEGNPAWEAGYPIELLEEIED